MALVRSLQYYARGLLLVVCIGLCGAHQPTVTAAAPGHTGHTLSAHRGVVEGQALPAAPATPGGFFALLGAGLLTGLSHCVGMCGPLVGALSLRRRAARRDLASPLVLFQLGRLLTYGLLGALAGSVGAVFASAVQAWQGLLAMSLGGLVVVSGVGLLGLMPVQHWLAAIVPAQWVHARLIALLDSQWALAPLGLGVANGFLPCGAVYTMAMLAALGADPLKGASLMLLFGLGTLPAMLGVGFSIGLLSVRLRSGLYRSAALLVVAVGVQLILRGLALEGYIAHVALGGLMLW